MLADMKERRSLSNILPRELKNMPQLNSDILKHTMITNPDHETGVMLECGSLVGSARAEPDMRHVWKSLRTATRSYYEIIPFEDSDHAYCNAHGK
jgi:hypothetical protein